MVRDFFVLMADLRRSSAHLRDGARGLTVSGMHRVFLETSALLPTLSKLVSMRHGGVTEYLGDGVLGFFAVDDIEDTDEFVQACDVGDECLETCADIVNDFLEKRYHLPCLSLGVGISVGQSIVTTIGSGDDARPVAFGLPVFEVSRLSKGENDVLISKKMRELWPKSKGGQRQFKEVSIRNFTGYRSTRGT